MSLILVKTQVNATGESSPEKDKSKVRKNQKLLEGQDKLYGMNSGRQKWVWDLSWDPGGWGAGGLGQGSWGPGILEGRDPGGLGFWRIGGTGRLGPGGLGAGSERYCRDQTCSSKGLGEESVEELRERQD